MRSVLKVDVLSHNLLRKGFREEPGDHMRYRFFLHGERTNITTKISHGEKEIGLHLIIKMSRQLHLDREQFIRFALCEISEEEYISLLSENDHPWISSES